MAKVKAECPETVVFSYDHFCMGSGWILLFLPILAVAFTIKRMRAGA